MTRPPKSTPEPRTSEPLDDNALEALFDAAPAAQPSAALTNRILADARAHQPQNAPRAAPPQRGLFAALAQALGGWPTLGGLATATLAGLYIGVAQPDLFSIPPSNLGVETSEEDALAGVLPGDTFLFETLFFEEG